MPTILGLRRLFVIAMTLLAAWNSSEATPIIVGRTTDGFLIGTNFTSSDGSKLCKVHSAGSKVLIVAGQPVKFGYQTPQSSATNWLFNIERELGTIPLSTLPPQKIMDAARAIIVGDVSKYAQYIIAKSDLRVTYAIVLVAVEVPRLPQLWIQELDFSKANGTFASKLDQPEMQPGTLMEVVNSQGPQFKSFPAINKGVIETELEGATQRHIQSSDPSYHPPYMVLRLSAKGMRFLTNDFGYCSGTHPVY
jgi:hypothetical protein